MKLFLQHRLTLPYSPHLLFPWQCAECAGVRLWQHDSRDLSLTPFGGSGSLRWW